MKEIPKQLVDFSVLIGKTLKQVLIPRHRIMFYMEDGEVYSLGNATKRRDAIYTESLIGKFSGLIGLPIIEAKVVPKIEKMKFSLNNEKYNTCADPEFPWGHYEITVGSSSKHKVVIRWFVDKSIITDFYSHQVKFYKINRDEYE